MKFGICATIADYETVKQAGYDAIALAGKDIAAMSDSDFKQACAVVSAGSLRLTNLYAFCTPPTILAGAGHDLQVLRQYTEKVFGRSKELGICYAGIGSPPSRVRPEGFPLEQMNAQMADSLKLLCEVGDKYGVEILLEAVCTQSNCSYITRTSEALEMISSLKLPNLNLVYDIYHAFMMGEGPEPILEAGSLIKVAHVSGNVGNVRGFLTETNSQEYYPYVQALKKIGYTGELNIEPNSGDITKEAVPSLGILRSMYK